LTESEHTAFIDAEPVTADDLRDLAARLEAAKARLAVAERALTDEKARQGLLARLNDLATETNVEAAVSNNKETVERLRQLAMRDVARWLRQRPVILAVEAEGAAGPVRRHLDLSERRQKLAKWHDLAAAAVAILEAGARTCNAAANVEFADAVLRSPMISIASLGVSGRALSALQDAKEAIGRLRAALPAHGVSFSVEGIDDSFDTFIDLLYKPSFDVLSWTNMTKHEQVAQKLEVTARMLTPLTVYLSQLADRTLSEIDEHAEEAKTIIAAYAQAAHDELPAELKDMAEESRSGA
jgi:hypothetical protein